jgi:hypothetical protein
MSEQFRSDVRKLCEARDFAQFSDLPQFIKEPLFRILDKMGEPCGYVPPSTELPDDPMDGFIIGGIKL